MFGILRSLLAALAMVLAAWAAAEAICTFSLNGNPVWIFLTVLAFVVFGVTAIQFARSLPERRLDDKSFGGSD